MAAKCAQPNENIVPAPWNPWLLAAASCAIKLRTYRKPVKSIPEATGHASHGNIAGGSHSTQWCLKFKANISHGCGKKGRWHDADNPCR